MIAVKFSPPAWGWSADPARRLARADVLPTRVGMVRRLSATLSPPNSSPHPRGDGPDKLAGLMIAVKFSPPAWGWSDLRHRPRRRSIVLPTRVGMVRVSPRSHAIPICSPHPRGDGPRGRSGVLRFPRFSPPAWGWSALPRPAMGRGGVLPTRVGMVRSWRPRRLG